MTELIVPQFPADVAYPLNTNPTRPADSLERPTFEMPAGAVDAHIHIFGPLDVYPSVEKPFYSVPDASLEQFKDVMRVLKLEHFAIVQPSFYGTDNRCLIDNLKAAGDIARGIVMIEHDADHETMRDYTDAGVRGIRLDLFKRAELPLEEIEAYITAMAAKVAPYGWHLQFYAPGYIVRDLIDFLGTLEIDFMIDHMGYMLEEDGLTEADFQRLLALMQNGHGWLKMSAPYRLAKKRGMEPVNEIAKAIVAAAPDRAIWGSDWPHIPWGELDTGILLNLLPIWAPDPADMKKILSDNPRKLMGFMR